MAIFNGPQSRAIRCGFLDIHRRMAELEGVISSTHQPTEFSDSVNDLSPAEATVVRDYCARIRTAMAGHLRECAIPVEIRPVSLRHALACGVSFIGVAVDNMRPPTLRGYGPLSPEAQAAVTRICTDLTRLVDQVSTYLRQGAGRDLPKRLARLEACQAGAQTLSRLERIVSRWRLVEFQPTLEWIAHRLEAPSFEIAVFGRVSTGKSSLLNHIIGAHALPVGVTPVTAVPTRVVAGRAPSVVVSFAEGRPHVAGVEQLAEYASEEGNSRNHKHVTSIVVQLPSPRLKEGIVFVDTPGVGSLALSGGAETAAYLPRCDLGLVLVDSSSILNQEDVALLRALYAAGIPAMVLLSKADLLQPGDRVRMTDYVREQLRQELGLDLAVRPVSTVGADESLLSAWLDQELSPLLDRHRGLAEASLKRKIAALEESVIATLETLLARERAGAPEHDGTVDANAALKVLDEADATIRLVQERVLEWAEERRALVNRLPRLAALSVVTARGGAPGTSLAGLLEEVLAERGRMAHDVVARLQDALAHRLESLARLAPVASADPSGIRGFHSGGLPVANLDGVRGARPILRPWWSGIAPGLAAGATERMVSDRFGDAIRDAVGFHDRQLEAWLKMKTAHLVELYEMQAGVFREQIRRRADRSPDAPDAGAAAVLAADLDELRTADRAAVPAQEAVTAATRG